MRVDILDIDKSRPFEFYVIAIRGTYVIDSIGCPRQSVRSRRMIMG